MSLVPMDFTAGDNKQTPGKVIVYIRNLEKRVSQQNDILDIIRTAFMDNRMKLTKLELSDLAIKVQGFVFSKSASRQSDIQQVLNEYIVETDG